MKLRMPLILIIIIPVIIGLIFILVIIEQPLTLFPARGKYFIDGDADKGAGGKSIINRLEIVNDHITFRYTLKKGIDTPYAFLYIRPDESDSLLNLSSHDYLVIKIAASAAKSVKLVLKVLKPGEPITSNPDSFLPLVTKVMTIKDMSLHEIPLKKFTFPGTWFQSYDTPEGDIKQKDYLKNISSFEMYISNVQPDVQDTIMIQEIAFHKTKTGAYIWLAVCFGIYCIGVITYVVIKRIRSGE